MCIIGLCQIRHLTSLSGCRAVKSGITGVGTGGKIVFLILNINTADSDHAAFYYTGSKNLQLSVVFTKFSDAS